MDGFLLGSAGRVGMDLEEVGVLASSEVNCAKVLTDEMESGKLNQIILEYNSGRVVLELIGTDIILAVIGTTQSNLGMLRLAINNLKTEVIKSIEV